MVVIVMIPNAITSLQTLLEEPFKEYIAFWFIYFFEYFREANVCKDF